MTIVPIENGNPPPAPTGFARLWADMVAAGWRTAVLRYASHGLLLALVLGVIALSRMTVNNLETLADEAQKQVAAVPVAVAAVNEAPLDRNTAPVFGPVVLDTSLLVRRVDPHTLIATRGRGEVVKYTVQAGDTLFGIAERYNLKPETILWGNYFTLKDDPHSLRIGQVLNVLPVDGTYHYVTAGNTVEQIARFYSVAPQAILDWAANQLDPDQPQLTLGGYVVVPGGQRESQAWVVPTLLRQSKVRANNNFGQCPGGYTGAIGGGTFTWPADNRALSGYDFSSVHHGIDIRASTGAAIYAVDGGVVVYAGWNDWGYGNLIVVDHGNGWQSVYAHLSQINVACGQSLTQKELIGLAGNTGRSSGPHLHFELRYNGAFVNPSSVLP